MLLLCGSGHKCPAPELLAPPPIRRWAPLWAGPCLALPVAYLHQPAETSRGFQEATLCRCRPENMKKRLPGFAPPIFGVNFMTPDWVSN